MPPRPVQRRPPSTGKSRNTYVREDQILPHLAALAILLADGGTVDDAGAVHVTVPADAASLIDQLRGSDAVLTYDPDTRTIPASGHHAVAVTTG